MYSNLLRHVSEMSTRDKCRADILRPNFFGLFPYQYYYTMCVATPFWHRELHKIARFLAWDRCPNMLSRCLCLDTEHLSRAQRKVKNTHSICCFRSWTMTSLKMRRGSAICRIPASTPALSSSPKTSWSRSQYRWRISAICRTPASTPALSSSPKNLLEKKDQRYLQDTGEHTNAVLFPKKPPWKGHGTGEEGSALSTGQPRAHQRCPLHQKPPWIGHSTDEGSALSAWHLRAHQCCPFHQNLPGIRRVQV